MSRPRGAVRLKAVHDPVAADDGVRVCLAADTDLRAVADLAAAEDVTLVADVRGLHGPQLTHLRATVVAMALRGLAEGALARSRRFEAILFFSPALSAPVVAGSSDRADELAALAEAVMAAGRAVALDGEDDAADRSPQCYLGLRSVLGLPLAHGGEIVGAAIAESGQIGPFSAVELEPVRAIASRAARLLA
jgi:GAF domain-containing protein